MGGNFRGFGRQDETPFLCCLAKSLEAAGADAGHYSLLNVNFAARFENS